MSRAVTRLMASPTPEVQDLRDLSYRQGQHRRTPAIVAELTVGLAWFLRDANQIGAVSSGQVKSYLARCEEALGVAADKQTDDQRAEEPTVKFLRLLAAALASGCDMWPLRTAVSPRTGRAPLTRSPPRLPVPGAGAAGTVAPTRFSATSGRPRDCVWAGWTVRICTWSRRSVSAVAQTLARDQGDGLAIGVQRLHAWWKRGLSLAARPGARLESTVQGAGRRA